MTIPEAKEVLLAYRPWAKDAADAELATALALCREDAELAKWFAEHCAWQDVLQSRFKKIPVPEGLREQILSEYQAHVQTRWWRRRSAVAVMACAVIAVSVTSIWMMLRPPAGEDLTFNGYRKRMVRTALRSYGMDLETNDVAQIRTYLAQNKAPADYVLPESLAQSPTVGCGVLTWQSKRVAMVCFRTGLPLAPGAKSDLFLFVIDQKDLGNMETESSKIVGVSELVTASWRAGEKVYLLAAFEEAELRKRL